MKKNITMKQYKGNGNYDELYPRTNSAQVDDLPEKLTINLNGRKAGDFDLRNGEDQSINLQTQGGGGDNPGASLFLTKTVFFTPISQRSAIWSDGGDTFPYGINYVDGIAILCSNSISDIVEAAGKRDHDNPTQPRPMLGMVALNADGDDDVFIGGYLYNGIFYEDAQHTVELDMMSGFIYYDKTPGQNNACYNWQEACWWELPVDFGADVQGYYNPADRLFYVDADFTTLMSGTEGYIYYDMATEKRYAYVAPCLLRNSVADWFFARHTVWIPASYVTGNGETGTRVKFQTLIDNDELSFMGIVHDSTEGALDMWSMNLSLNKYQEKANLVQEIGKDNPDLYPSVIAVKNYVQQNS